MSDYMIQGETLTAIADAIRSKAGTSSSYTPSEMVTAIEGISGGGGGDGGSEFLDNLLMRQLTEVDIQNESAYLLPSYFLANQSLLESVTAPYVTATGDYCFLSCTSLKSVDLPNFVGASGLTGVFEGCAGLENISLILDEIGSSFFANCSSLQSAELSRAMYVGQFAFYECISLSTLTLDSCYSIESYAFLECSSLHTIDLPKIGWIGDYAFSRCTALKSIYLRASSVCALTSYYAFSGTPIWSGSGTIYVPSSLYNAYAADTDWGRFSSRLSSITS